MNLRSRIAAGGIAIAAALTPSVPAVAVVGGGAAALTAASVITADQALANGERVQNSIASSKSISVRVWDGVRSTDHILGRGQGYSAGAQRISSWLCPSNTRCSYSVNGGAVRRVTGPVRINLADRAAVSVTATS